MRNSNIELEQWLSKREWAQGWSVDADDSVDGQEWHDQYEKNKELWDMLFDFLAKNDVRTLEVGKIVLVPDRLWINVMAYTPKPAEETKAECHRKYIDLQYTFEGNEYMLLPHEWRDEEPYNELKDVTKFKAGKDADISTAESGRFYLYFPKDIHQPSVASKENPGISRKIVGKIEYAG